MTTLLIFLAFVILHLIGQHGMNRIGSYENRYGLMALVGILGALLTGIVAFFMSFAFWSIVIIAALYLYMRHVHPKVFG